MSLHRLLYTSRSSAPGGQAMNARGREIAERARLSNARAGLTGALLLVRGFYVQSLEGPLDTLEAVFERICHDLRHRDLQLLDFAPAAERIFTRWTMGFVEASGDELEPLVGDIDEARILLGLDTHEAIARMRHAMAA